MNSKLQMGNCDSVDVQEENVRNSEVKQEDRQQQETQQNILGANVKFVESNYGGMQISDGWKNLIIIFQNRYNFTLKKLLKIKTSHKNRWQGTSRHSYLLCFDANGCHVGWCYKNYYKTCQDLYTKLHFAIADLGDPVVGQEMTKYYPGGGIKKIIDYLILLNSSRFKFIIYNPKFNWYSIGNFHLEFVPLILVEYLLFPSKNKDYWKLS